MIPVARFTYLDGENRPSNIKYAVFDYATISDIQYEYGLYLQELITDGDLSINDIKVRNPDRIKYEPWSHK